MVKIKITEKIQGVKWCCVDEWRGVVVGAGDGWKKGDKVGGPAHLLAFAIDPEGYKRAYVGDVVELGGSENSFCPFFTKAEIMDSWLEQDGKLFERITGPWVTI